MVSELNVIPTMLDKLLGLSDKELLDRYRSRVNYYIYKGACEDELAAMQDAALTGQTWTPNEDIDYKPSVDIRNKIKALMNKQKRFMFGVSPTIQIKPFNIADKQSCEDLRFFIDKILKDNGFWKDTMRAFLSCTIRKKVLLRVEAMPNKPVSIFYAPIENFNFIVNSENYKIIDKVIIVVQDSDTIDNPPEDQLWHRYTYSMSDKTKTCILTTDTFNGVEDIEVYTTEVVDTKLSRLPAWVIVNGGDLGDYKGESDVDDLKGMQNSYNRRVSDFGDALRFQMFGETYMIDASEESVRKAYIAPNSLIPVQSYNDDRKASVQKIQSSFNSSAPVQAYLKDAEKDMYEALGMPSQEELRNALSGKAMKFLYTDLVARCEEKWQEWDEPIKELIEFLVEVCGKLNLYSDWNNTWNTLKYSITLKHNYPIPEDEQTNKETALKEVQANTRSRKEYIKDFTDEEDVEGSWINILDEVVQLKSATQDQFQVGITTELAGIENDLTTNKAIADAKIKTDAKAVIDAQKLADSKIISPMMGAKVAK